MVTDYFKIDLEAWLLQYHRFVGPLKETIDGDPQSPHPMRCEKESNQTVGKAVAFHFKLAQLCRIQ